MSRPLGPEEIEAFSDIVLVPNSDVGPQAVTGVRQLREQMLETFLRNILFNPNETPHCATEIADIITHVIIKGERQLAAFVLKGASYSKVSSKDVSHQFHKLRTIPQLRVIAFGAVGHIHDDATRDFLQTAEDAEADYLELNTLTLARLLIAYGHVCPMDGLPYGSDRVCPNGHNKTDNISLPDRSSPILVNPRVLDLGTTDFRKVVTLTVQNISKYVYHDVYISVVCGERSLCPGNILLTPPKPKGDHVFQIGSKQAVLDIMYGEGVFSNDKAGFIIKFIDLDPDSIHRFRLEIHPGVDLPTNDPVKMVASVTNYGQEPAGIARIRPPYKKFDKLHQTTALLLDSNKLQEAEKHCRELVKFAKKGVLRVDPRRARAEHLMGIIMERLGATMRAGLHYNAALTIAENALVPNHNAVAEILEDMAGFHSEAGDDKKAQELMNRVHEIRHQEDPESDGPVRFSVLDIESDQGAGH